MEEKQVSYGTQEQKINKVDEFITDATDAIKKRLSSLRTQAHIVYGCYLASFIIGITLIIGVIVAYIARNNAQELNEQILVDHFTWQIRTFWIGLIFTVITIVSIFTIFLPLIIGIAGLIWFIYRIIKGWTYLSSNKRLYAK